MNAGDAPDADGFLIDPGPAVAPLCEDAATAPPGSVTAGRDCTRPGRESCETAGTAETAETAGPTCDEATPLLDRELIDIAEAITRLDTCAQLRSGDPDAFVALMAQFDRFEARCARAAVDFEAGGSWIADGARSAGAWIARRCHTAKSHAFRLVRLGRAVSKRQALAAAWFDGEVGSTQVGLIAGLENRRTAEALRRDEEMLVGQAKELSAEEFAHACQYWAQLADPDGAEQSERDRIDRRDVQLHPSISGTWFGSMTLDPVSGEIVNDELCRIENELFEADWKEATDRLGRRPGAHELQRTGSQRRADSLVEMAARSAAATAGTRYPVPLFNVLIDFDTFGRVCELASGAVTTPGNLVKYLATADWERALFRPPNRVDVGRRARFFTGATRRAIELRDRHCVHAYCDVPASRCQVDHIVPYAQGGETVQENGRLLCPAHNRARNNEPRARLPEPPGDPPDGPDPGPEHDPPRLDDP